MQGLPDSLSNSALHLTLNLQVFLLSLLDCEMSVHMTQVLRIG